jgi:hypothetical protein
MRILDEQEMNRTAGRRTDEALGSLSGASDRSEIFVLAKVIHRKPLTNTTAIVR